MTDRTKIENGIKNFAGNSTVDAAIALLSALEYNTSRCVNTPIGKAKLSNAEVKNASLFMQLTDDEMSSAESHFGTGKIDDKNIESYLFVAVDLDQSEYNRSTLAKITRDINKLFAIPVFVVFRYGSYLTLSIIYRRIHKRDEQKDVLEKVTLIKDINVNEPHRGHIDILCDLALPKICKQYPVTNFVELDDAWRKVLDTKELNKRFYKEIANWFHWAKTEAKFPGGADEVNLLRLLTRIIFIWFIKEKKLVPDNLFNENIIADCVNGKNHYYNAILQNLFFGTLNCVIEDRKFRDERTCQGKNDSYGVKTQYRYADLFKCSEKEAKKLFATIPFLNGGLFDCLDIDGFSDTKKRATLPDELFFGEKKQIDLSCVFGAKYKKVDVYGLFHTLNRYKFTVAENTPLEEDIALDPELLGNVFENLLAAYNPETKETARKSTGSFYTPREIVDYMVEQSLANYPENDWQKLKILDPACGSGAFPMGVLNAMVNRFAKEKSHVERYELKKHIIENCLFGVDIQPIAIQITKLRFFISLVCEQEKNETQENFGITALPNLETKFVAANTLIGLEKDETLFRSSEIVDKENELKEIRHMYFSANTRKKKLDLQKEDETKRKELADILVNSNWSKGVAEKIAGWNPYDQNIAADWFDPEWMFGITDGFDVVIGNPPYRFLSGKGSPVKQLEKSGDHKGAQILKNLFDRYATRFKLSSKGCRDLYKWFIEIAFTLVKSQGIVTYITPNTYVTLKNYADVRKIILNDNTTKFIIDLGFGVFEEPIVPSAIFLSKHKKKMEKIVYCDLKHIRKNDLMKQNLPSFIEENKVSVPISGADILLYKHDLAKKLYSDDCMCTIDKYVAISEGEHNITINRDNISDINSDNKIAAIWVNELSRFVTAKLVYISKSDCKNYDNNLHSGARCFLRKTGERIIVAPSPTEELAIAHQNVYVGYACSDEIDVNAIIGILNSCLLTFLYQNGIHGQKGRIMAQFRIYALYMLPIPEIIDDKKTICESIANMVISVVKTKNETPGADTSALEHEIDALVFHLYGLTEEEMMTVLQSQNVSETDRQRIQAFYKEYETL